MTRDHALASVRKLAVALPADDQDAAVARLMERVSVHEQAEDCSGTSDELGAGPSSRPADESLLQPWMRRRGTDRVDVRHLRPAAVPGV